MLFDRPRCPAKVRPEEALEPWSGVTSVVTPGARVENPMNVRPLIGRLAICCAEMVVAISLRRTSTAGEPPTTVIVSLVAETLSVIVRVVELPTCRATPSRTWVVNPERLASTR